MFANTLTLALAGGNKVLTRINQDKYGSEYAFSDALESITLQIRHSLDNPGKDGVAMKRHNLFVERIVYPAGTNGLLKYTSTVTFRNAVYGDPAAGADLQKAVNVLLAAASSAMITGMSTGEN